jgi:hypothetical protein
MKVKYNATPTRREREYHQWLIAEHECSCGCRLPSTVVHHPLTRHPEQRWRRDHEYVVPMADECHRALHAMGSERLFSDVDFAGLAAWHRKEAIEAYRL